MNNLKLKDKVYFIWNDFDGSGVIEATIRNIETDHIIAKDRYSNLWLDFKDFNKRWFTSYAKAQKGLEYL